MNAPTPMHRPVRMIDLYRTWIEAVCIGAVLLIPSFVNTYSERSFEPDKAALLQSLSVLIVSAWILAFLFGRPRSSAEGSTHSPCAPVFPRQPVFLAVLAFGASLLLSSWFSITPWESFWGSYARAQGVYTTAAALVLFVGICASIRSTAQIERLVTALVVAGLPVCIFALFQAAEVDTRFLTGRRGVLRVTGLIGNASFLGGYLVLVFPLTVRQACLGISRAGKPSGAASLCAGLGYALFAAVQLAVLYRTGSRGPMLGLLCGLILAGALCLWIARRARVACVIAIVPALAALLLLLFPPAAPEWLSNLDDRTHLGRLTDLFQPEGGKRRSRVAIWEGAWDIMTAADKPSRGDVRGGLSPGARALIGYGPESIGMAMLDSFVPALGEMKQYEKVPDRTHNDTWDRIVMLGVTGVTAYLALILALFFLGLKHLGVIRSKSDARRFIAFATVATIAGGLIAAARGGPALLGIGVPAGLVTGLLLFCGVSFLCGQRSARQDGPRVNFADGSLVIAILTAMLSHFAEIQVRFVSVLTEVCFWSLAGILVAIAGRDGGFEKEEAEPVSNGWCRDSLIAGILLGMILSTTGYSLMNNEDRVEEVGQVLAVNLAGTTGWTLLLTALLAGPLLAWRPRAESQGSHTKCTVLLVLTAVAIFAVFAVVHAGALARVAGFHPETPADLISSMKDMQQLPTRYIVWMGLLLSGLGCALFGGIRSLRSVPARMYLAVGFVLVAVAGPYVYRVHLRPIHADMAVKSANRFSKTSRWREAGILYPAALSVESKRHQYYFDFANSLHENARTSTNSVERTRWSLHAIHQLTRAAELAPLNPDYPANLGRHYTWMGTVAADPEMKRVFAEEADDHFQDALRMSPRMPRYWCDRAELYRAVLDQPGTAEALILHALELDSEYWMTHKMLGSVYATVAVNQQDGEAQREFLSKAVEQYETALRLAEPIRKLPLRRDIHRAAGKIYEILGVKTKADEHFALGEKAKRKRKSKR